ncbi:MAG: hypothetical protein G01um101431_975 [Parcubacteria group bacterium Gr01-1014_31]|nr:MAG: hypothetical protein G01um101431_975 [Parcubacteria group bacterium Gr01-1014_31]
MGKNRAPLVGLIVALGLVLFGLFMGARWLTTSRRTPVPPVTVWGRFLEYTPSSLTVTIDQAPVAPTGQDTLPPVGTERRTVFPLTPQTTLVAEYFMGDGERATLILSEPLNFMNLLPGTALQIEAIPLGNGKWRTLSVRRRQSISRPNADDPATAGDTNIPPPISPP